LAHRSTNFKLGFGSNLFKQSGAQTDYEAVMLGILVPHMAFGHHATKIAVDIAKKLNFTLSITGHSLGAFLAEISVYYCVYELDCKYVKAVVFDGPGTFNLMKSLDKNKIENSINMITLREFDIVSYITAPNLDNCCNSHLGKVFTIFPKLEKDLGIYSKIIEKTIESKYESGLCTTIYGHDLINILPYFDVETGRPYKLKLVLRWPEISHKDIGTKKNMNQIKTSIINKLFSGSAEMIQGFLNLFIKKQEVLSTIESLVLVLQDFLNGRIKLEQFWNVHKFINIENDFHKPKDLPEKEEFNLVYNLNYHIKPYNLYELTLNDNNDIDRYLKLTKITEESLKEILTSIEMLIPFWDYYNYYEGMNEIKIYNDYRKEISVNDLRDYMRFLLIKKPDLLNNLTSANTNKQALASNKTDSEIKLN